MKKTKLCRSRLYNTLPDFEKLTMDFCSWYTIKLYFQLIRKFMEIYVFVFVPSLFKNNKVVFTVLEEI